MKRVIVFILMLAPVLCFAETSSMQLQMLDSEIERLTAQRDEKYAALQKCEQTTKGFKIAGLTTLVATGVGVYGNIKLSQKLKGGGSTGSKGGKLVDPRSDDEKDCSACDAPCQSRNINEVTRSIMTELHCEKCDSCKGISW